MRSVTTILFYEVWLFLLVLAAVVAHRLITNRINTVGLLHNKGSSRGFSSTRLQMLVTTVVVAGYYLMQVFSTAENKLPVLPNEMIIALGGSHSLYLGSKLFSRLMQKLGL